MIQAPNCSNQRDEDMKLSHTRDTRHERDTKQASKQRATRSNKNQSMKEQRTAPPSRSRCQIKLPGDPPTHMHKPSKILFLMMILGTCMPFQSISREISGSDAKTPRPSINQSINRNEDLINQMQHVCVDKREFESMCENLILSLYSITTREKERDDCKVCDAHS